MSKYSDLLQPRRFQSDPIAEFPRNELLNEQFDQALLSPFFFIKEDVWQNPLIIATQTSSVFNVSANTLYAVPFLVPRSLKITDLAAEVNTGNSVDTKIRLGIYTNQADGIYPDKLIVDGGEQTFIGGITTGVKSVSISEILDRMLIWIVFLTDQSFGLEGTSTYLPLLGDPTTLKSPQGGISVAQTYGPLPQSFPAGGTGLTLIPILCCKFKIFEKLSLENF